MGKISDSIRPDPIRKKLGSDRIELKAISDQMQYCQPDLIRKLDLVASKKKKRKHLTLVHTNHNLVFTQKHTRYHTIHTRIHTQITIYTNTHHTIHMHTTHTEQLQPPSPAYPQASTSSQLSTLNCLNNRAKHTHSYKCSVVTVDHHLQMQPPDLLLRACTITNFLQI